LLHEIQMRHDLTCGGCGGGHHVMILGQPRGGAVIHDMPVLAQHKAVARAAHFERAEHIGIDEIKECACVRPFDVDLTER